MKLNLPEKIISVQNWTKIVFLTKKPESSKSFLIDETKFFQQENVISFIFPFSLMNQNATKIVQLKGKFAAKMQKTIFRASKESSKTIIT